MELVELLSQTGVIRDDELERQAKPFIFNEALLRGCPKLRMIMLLAIVSTGYSGF